MGIGMDAYEQMGRELFEKSQGAPILLIGMGGVGGRIVAQIDKMLAKDSPRRDKVAILAIDTNVKDLRKLREQGIETIQISVLLRIEGAVLCGGLLEGIRLISRGGIGMGDVKLMTACGFFLGITTGAVSLVFAYILAGMFCLPLLIFKKASLKTRLPMAPFFTVSILIFLFFL